jgi:lipoprotein-anchoring transpeptidase ErfK/SrfK
MDRGFRLFTRGLWALAGVIGGASLGLILADRAGMLAGASSPPTMAPLTSATSLLPETGPLGVLTAAALPPVVIPIEFGPSPGRAAAVQEPAPLPPIPEKPVQVAAIPKADLPKSDLAKPAQPKPAALPVPKAPPQPEASAPAEAILISVADRKLRVLLADGSSRSFPIAVGRSRDLIPIGTTEILRKRRNPTWVPTPEMRRRDPKLPVSVPPGPRNPMGLYALDLGWTYYRIHGTNEPQSIGRAASSGCFRMLPKDIEAVFKLVDVGTKVTVIEGRLPKLPDPTPPPVPETKAL